MWFNMNAHASVTQTLAMAPAEQIVKNMHNDDDDDRGCVDSRACPHSHACTRTNTHADSVCCTHVGDVLAHSVRGGWRARFTHLSQLNIGWRHDSVPYIEYTMTLPCNSTQTHTYTHIHTTANGSVPISSLSATPNGEVVANLWRGQLREERRRGGAEWLISKPRSLFVCVCVRTVFP